MLGIDAEEDEDEQFWDAVFDKGPVSEGDHREQAREEGSGLGQDEGEFGNSSVPEAYVPAAPSAEEVRKHELSHWPFRNWCM